MGTFAGVHIVFSSVIPLDAQHQNTDIWKTALAFGASCDVDITSRTTHLVAAKVCQPAVPVKHILIRLQRGTAKVDAARRRGNIHIVKLEWFGDSVALWARQDEARYALEVPMARLPPPPSPVQDVLDALGSSDLDFDTDDWDDDDDPDSAPGSLTTTPSKKPVAPASAEKGADAPGGRPAGETGEDVDVDVDWAELDAEVEAAMNESDTEDGGSDRGDVPSPEAQPSGR
jgi:RNA polymerase II subunit A-like phosphatase